MTYTTAIWLGGGASAFVMATIWLNVRGRRRERHLLQIRGAQDAKSFAAMFAAEAEQAVATALYPRLQRITYTHAVPFTKDDTFRALDFDAEDLLDEVMAIFGDLGSNTPTSRELSQELTGVSTVGELVAALARLRMRDAAANSAT